VHLGTGTVKVTDDGGHTGLVAHGGSQVDGLLGVILGEAIRKNEVSAHQSPPKIFASQELNAPLDLTAVAGSALAREVGQGAWSEILVSSHMKSFFFPSCVSKFRFGAGEIVY
jgi:hypothetical protein